jgi:hypothetical protein
MYGIGWRSGESNYVNPVLGGLNIQVLEYRHWFPRGLNNEKRDAMVVTAVRGVAS